MLIGEIGQYATAYRKDNMIKIALAYGKLTYIGQFQ